MLLNDDFTDAWDELDRSISRMITAQPFQMTAAAERLEEARRKVRDQIDQASRTTRVKLST